MLAFITKILKVLPLTLTSVLGIAQAVLKFAKEVITLIINLFFPFTPDDGKFEKFVMKARDIINKISDWLEKGKAWLLKVGIKI